MAGRITTNQVQLGDSATASQNFHLQTNVDGTLSLNRGNVGASLGSVLSVDTAGRISMPSNYYLITDSTNIALTQALGTGQQNVGAPFTMNIPANGVIKLSSISGRFLNSATAQAHNYAFGIRIGATNYWFAQSNSNGSLITTSQACLVISGNGAGSFYEYYGSSVPGANAFTATGSSGSGTLDVASLAIPTGNQTVQLVTAFVTNAGTIQGAVKQTRVYLEVLG